MTPGSITLVTLLVLAAAPAAVMVSAAVLMLILLTGIAHLSGPHRTSTGRTSR